MEGVKMSLSRSSWQQGFGITSAELLIASASGPGEETSTGQ